MRDCTFEHGVNPARPISGRSDAKTAVRARAEFAPARTADGLGRGANAPWPRTQDDRSEASVSEERCRQPRGRCRPSGPFPRPKPTRTPLPAPVPSAWRVRIFGGRAQFTCSTSTAATRVGVGDAGGPQFPEVAVARGLVRHLRVPRGRRVARRASVGGGTRACGSGGGIEPDYVL